MNLHPSFDQPGFQCLCERVISKPGYDINYISFYNLCGVEFVCTKERREKEGAVEVMIERVTEIIIISYDSYDLKL